MNNANRIADELVNGFVTNLDLNWDYLKLSITKALREYGDAEYKRGMSYRETYFSEELEKEYQRGLGEAHKLANAYQDLRVASYDMIRVIEELQRGTGGGE